MNEELQRNFSAPALEVKGENIVLGTVGALLGALVGAALIAILAKIGYVASISGVVMAYLSLFLYTKFAGKLSVKGIIISIVIMVITVFVTEWLVYSFAFYKELKDYGFTLGDIIKGLPDLLELAEAKGGFVKDILMVYAFTALGAVPQIKNFAGGKTEAAMKPVEQTLANGNTIVNSTENIDSDLLNKEEEPKKFDSDFFG